METSKCERNSQQLELLNSQAVQSHIAMLQGIINRMAGNSANCKTWAIAIIAALVSIMMGREVSSEKSLLMLIPIAVFYILDCYYLGLERHFIKEQGNFVKSLKSTRNINLFQVGKTGDFCSQFSSTIRGMKSFSTTPFYGMMMLMIFFIWLKG